MDDELGPLLIAPPQSTPEIVFGCFGVSERAATFDARQQPRQRADYVLKWSGAQHDAAVAHAHLS
jgi:hypothetical protein